MTVNDTDEMTSIERAAAELAAALGAVPALRVHTDPAANLTPPATVVGPPTLAWEDVGPEPTSARFLVIVVERVDEHALPRLWALVPLVAAALDALPDAVVIRATPGSWKTGPTELPCYEIEIEVSL